MSGEQFEAAMKGEEIPINTDADDDEETTSENETEEKPASTTKNET